jgi:hypothetical protein
MVSQDHKQGSLGKDLGRRLWDRWEEFIEVFLFSLAVSTTDEPI